MTCLFRPVFNPNADFSPKAAAAADAAIRGECSNLDPTELDRCGVRDPASEGEGEASRLEGTEPLAAGTESEADRLGASRGESWPSATGAGEAASGVGRSSRRIWGQCLQVVRRSGFVAAMSRPCGGCSGAIT